MARIAIADRTSDYDGQSPEVRPLGGTETSVIHLAEALARRGHEVVCLTHCQKSIVHRQVRWTPLQNGISGPCDGLLAVQHPELLDAVPHAKRRTLWMVWPPYNVGRRWNVLRMWWHRPRVVFVSDFQRGRYPRRLPSPASTLVIPLGLPDRIRGRRPLSVPPRRNAIFASNPMRNLTWLIDLWGRKIRPHVPGAELHICGLRDYKHRFGLPWEETFDRFGRFLPENSLPETLASLKPHEPAAQEAVWEAMRASRVMLYGGHRAEAFCLAVAEAQALGIPAVVRPIAVLPERVRHGVTGFVEADDERFAQRAVELLTDDAVWRRQHEAALSLQQGWSWDQVAAAFDGHVLER